MPTVAAGGGHILKIDFFNSKSTNANQHEAPEGQGWPWQRNGGNAPAGSSSPEEEEDPTPKQGKASSVAEALADAQAELEAQSASAGEESALPQSGGALSVVIKHLSADSQRLKDENAEFKTKVEVLEEQVRSLRVGIHLFRNVISNNSSLSFRKIALRFFHRLHLRALQRAGYLY